MVRKNLDWKLWKRWMLAGLAEPYNSTPYVHVGLRRALYIINLLGRERFEDLFRNWRRRTGSLGIVHLDTCIIFKADFHSIKY